ncbi:MAG: ABC transporter ATP-binding protein [Bacteroidetes bacterium]|jgi:ABC-type lipoprotein export system ATPase subunit|nr:ABC transporter ATP-binding protein [Bacteroidota bacterium]MBX7130447.1 ABC transporter ATP-binding protein [Flavobacteriales bacterium]MCC6653842.1 ABC transporter ATP-binding protein [Flavobacteriales bacterium]HMZ49852.1 ABC transporter ATP-binding protein [Flavobacteriales bacterium]HNA34362.1 ABC transporter ATP-binding protein [Flavobacteriales bacterium]
MVPAFRLRDLVLGYGGRAVLESGVLDIPPGKVTCVIGPSGTGKSTLLETIGLMSDTFLSTTGPEAAFAIEGEDLDPRTLWATGRERLAAIRRERFSFIFQSTNLMPNFTIGENIRVAAHGTGADGALEDRLAVLLDAMRLPRNVLDKPAHAVSGGQKQRIAFIRALVKDFSILLADEPTGNLDPDNSVALFSVLKAHLAERGRTAVIVTHHLDLAETFGDLVLAIEPRGEGPAAITVRKRPVAS